MTTKNNTEGTNQNADASNGEVITLAQYKELESKFHEAVSTRDKSKDKLRKLEQDFAQVEEIRKERDNLLTDKSKTLEQLEALTSEFNGYKSGIQAEKVNSILQSAAEKSGAKSVSTVLKLIDKSKVELDENGNAKQESIDLLFKELIESDPVLFGEDNKFIDPGVKRAGEGSPDSMFEKEIRAAKSQKEIESVLRKYGK